MKVIIDRFEGIYAVCEKSDRTLIDILIENLPKGCREGDVLNLEDSAITIDVEETEKRKKRIEEIAKDLWND